MARVGAGTPARYSSSPIAAFRLRRTSTTVFSFLVSIAVLACFLGGLRLDHRSNGNDFRAETAPPVALIAVPQIKSTQLTIVRRTRRPTLKPLTVAATRRPLPPTPSPTPRQTQVKAPAPSVGYFVVYHPALVRDRPPGFEMLSKMRVTVRGQKQTEAKFQDDVDPSILPNPNGARTNLIELVDPYCYVVIVPADSPAHLDVIRTWATASTIIAQHDQSELNVTGTTQSVRLNFSAWKEWTSHQLKMLHETLAVKQRPQFGLGEQPSDGSDNRGWFPTFHFLTQMVKSNHAAFRRCLWFTLVHPDVVVRTTQLGTGFLGKMNSQANLRMGMDVPFDTWPYNLTTSRFRFAYAAAAGSVTLSRSILSQVDTASCVTKMKSEPILLSADDAAIGFCLSFFSKTTVEDSPVLPAIVAAATTTDLQALLAVTRNISVGEATCDECAAILRPVNSSLALQLAVGADVQRARIHDCTNRFCAALLVDGLPDSIGSSWPLSSPLVKSLRQRVREVYSKRQLQPSPGAPSQRG
jgi:hypothetical protein